MLSKRAIFGSSFREAGLEHVITLAKVVSGSEFASLRLAQIVWGHQTHHRRSSTDIHFDNNNILLHDLHHK